MIEDRRQLFLDVAHVQILGVERILAVLAVPQEAVFFLGAALAFDHQPHAIREALR